MGSIDVRILRAPSALLGLAAALAVGFAVWLLAGSPDGTRTLFMQWIYPGSILAAAGACLTRGFSNAENRHAWLAFGVALCCWAAGDIYWTLRFDGDPSPPDSSPADVGYLLAIPFAFAAIALLFRDRLGDFPMAGWFDGTASALAVVAVGLALLDPGLLDPGGPVLAALPAVAGLLLLGFGAGAVIVNRLYASVTLLLVGSGALVWTAADAAYLSMLSTGSYTGGGVDLLWPCGALLIAAGACVVEPAPRSPRPRRYRPPRLIPVGAGVVAIGVLSWDHFETLPALSVIAAAGTLLALIARLLISASEYDRLMDALHSEATTDPLTGLPNRRKLFQDLTDYLERPPAVDPGAVFALFDLDGFKGYNDTFGHPAGDVLLRRLGEALAQAVAGDGTAYRLGGDEFCILCGLDDRPPVTLIDRACAALSAHGEAFSIGASCGSVELPGEASTAAETVGLADGRMYEAKGSRATRTDQRTQEALLRVLREREPTLTTHMEGVARLAGAVARRAGLDAEQVDVITRAAELHDIGKVAIPDEVLAKPGPLNDEEWRLMRRHTVIGERMIGVSTAMRPVGALVRSSHERWDGNGYPDGLRRSEIPLGSRIILACDAFDAMTNARSHQPLLSVMEAIAELNRSAGTQLDPTVVELLCEVLRDGLVHGSPQSSDERRGTTS